MREIDKLVVIPLISVILVIISLLIPLAFRLLSNSTLYGYPFGLLLVSTVPSLSMTPAVFDTPSRSSIGVLTVFFYGFAVVLLLAMLIKYKRSSISKKYIVRLLFLSGVLIIGGFITSLIALGIFILEGYSMTIIGLLLSPIAGILAFYEAIITRKKE